MTPSLVLAFVAHGADAPPAGGTAIGEVIAASLVAMSAIFLVTALGVAHRRRGYLNPIAAATEERTGLPAWTVLPVMIVGTSLLIAVWGYYWDVSWHIDRGRDPGAFANPAHWFIIIGLDGIAFGGLLAMILGDNRSPSSVRLTDKWSVPVGAIMLSACGVVALAGFPLDDIWHRLFGQDVTAWGPTHIQLIGGASLSTLACWALVVEGQRATADRAAERPALGRLLVRVVDVGFAGALLIGLSTLQVEFDFGVPQFRGVFHPILIALGASIALVAVRIRLGRGGALISVAFFWVARGLLTTGIIASGRSTQHIPLYVAEALLVEVVFAVIGRERQLTGGAVAGALIGTVGLASEWLWSHIWMPEPWGADLLPEVIPLTLAAAIAGGVIGGLVGRALAPDDVARQPSPRFAAAASWATVVVVLGICLPITETTSWQAAIRLTDRQTSGDTTTARVAVTLSKGADRVARHAEWFEVIAWQGASHGGDGGLDRSTMQRRGDGTWMSSAAVPMSGSYKTMLRLHAGTGMQAVPIYLPADSAIHAKEVPATDATRPFQREKSILQREAKTDNVMLERLAYLVVAAIAFGWILLLSWGLRRLDPTPDPRHPARTRQRQPSVAISSS
jgi:hypothetical protein